MQHAKHRLILAIDRLISLRKGPNMSESISKFEYFGIVTGER